MGRDRGLLHVNQLDAFKAWAADSGWIEEPAKGHYEVFRLRRTGNEHPAIYYQRAHETVHVTSWGVGLTLAHRYIRHRRTERSSE